MKTKTTRPVRRLIVKVGTANLCDKSGKLKKEIFTNFARQVVKLMKSGVEVVIVSSGSIKTGRERMDELNLDTTQLHKKDLAGIGARHLLNRWGEAFEPYGKEVGQVWVTFGNWTDKGERKSIKSSVFGYLNSGVVIPVVNESDVISDREIKTYEKGLSENDRLARMVAFLVDADAVLFLTDIGGIYTEDPRKNLRARLYKEINIHASPRLVGISNGTSKNGTGGMAAKWKEASQCAKRGMLVAIAGNEKDVILRFVKGKSVGTKVGITNRFK